MSQLRITLEVTLIALPLGILLLVVISKAWGAVLSPFRVVVLSLGLFAVMCIALIADSVLERRFLGYESTMVLATAGFVAVRVVKFIKSPRRN